MHPFLRNDKQQARIESSLFYKKNNKYIKVVLLLNTLEKGKKILRF